MALLKFKAVGHCLAVIALAMPTAANDPDNPLDAILERARTAETKGLDALLEFQTTRWFTDAFRASRKDVLDASVAVFLANPAWAYAETCRMLGAFTGVAVGSAASGRPRSRRSS